jgi:hypothetical protein
MARAMEFYSLDVTEGVEEALAKGMDRLTLVLTSEEKPSLTDIIKFSSREANGEYKPWKRPKEIVGDTAYDCGNSRIYLRKKRLSTYGL